MPISRILTPKDIGETLKLISNGGLILSGGQALVPEIRQGNYRKKITDLIDISNLTEINSKTSLKNSILSIGAGITIRELIEDQNVQGNAKFLIEAAHSLGDCQVRNSATLGGNLCWGEPRANLLIALIAASTTVELVDKSMKIKKISLKTLYEQKISRGIKDFVLLSAEVNLNDITTSSYQEFSRQKNDLALVNLALIEKGDLISGCIGGLFNYPFEFKKVEKSGMKTTIMNLVKTTKITKMTNQFADFDHRLNILESILSNTIRAD